MKRVPANELEYPGDGLHYLDDLRFTGIALGLTKDGFEKSQIEYKEGLLSGRTTEWYAPGVPMVESNHFKGVLHGRACEWHKNGQLAEEGEYEFGIVLWEKEWTENGGLIREYRIDESGPQFDLLLVYRKEFGS